MRNEVLDFAFGFVPMAVTGLALAIAGGRMTAVYCGTLTPVPPTAAPFSGFDPGAPCISSAWVPYWPGLYFVAAGAVLGLVLLAVETPLPRRRGEGAGGPGLPARDPSTTTHLLGVDTMLPRLDKSQAERDFVRGRSGPPVSPRPWTRRLVPCPSGGTD